MVQAAWDGMAVEAVVAKASRGGRGRGEGPKERDACRQALARESMARESGRVKADEGGAHLNFSSRPVRICV